MSPSSPECRQAASPGTCRSIAGTGCRPGFAEPVGGPGDRRLLPIHDAQWHSVPQSAIIRMDETPIRAGRHPGKPGKMKKGCFRPVPGERGEVVFPFATSRRHRRLRGPCRRPPGSSRASGLPGARPEEIRGTEGQPPGDGRRVPAVVRARGKDPEPAPKRPIRKAIGYATCRRATPEVFLEDPEVPPDVNLVERALRPARPGRRNRLSARPGTGAGHAGTRVASSPPAGCRAPIPAPGRPTVSFVQATTRPAGGTGRHRSGGRRCSPAIR